MIADKLASSVTDRVDVGSSARLILGHRGETIRRIQEMCNVTADIVGELGESERVEITGEREDVTRAKKMVADKLASSVTDYIEIRNFERLFIGNGGETNQRLSKQFNVTIRLVGEYGKRRARISGYPEHVKKVKKEIQSIMDDSGSVTDRVDVGSSARLILGHSGETIQRIQEMCNVTADIVGELGESERVEITGEREDVTRAKKMVADKLASSVTERVDVGSSAKLIPRRRSRLRSPLSSHEPWSIGKGGASKQIIRPKPNKRYPDITEH
eukprot:972768_1